MKTSHLFTYLALFGGAAVAQSPHFVGNPSASITDSGILVVSFKEAGLGANQLINYTVTADFDATYQCCNMGGRHPHAGNKEKITGLVSGTATFSSGKNGNIQGSIETDGPSPGDFSCPAGQNLLLTSVAYSDILLMDTTTPVGPVTVPNPSPVMPDVCSK